MFPRRRGPAALALAVAAALTLAACGGSADDGKDAGSAGGGDKKAVAQGGEDFGSAAGKTAAMGTDAKPGECRAPCGTRWASP
jgi:iron complex transport system substrate-binding protein